MTRTILGIERRLAIGVIGSCLLFGLVLAGFHAHPEPTSGSEGCPACALARAPFVQMVVCSVSSPPVFEPIPKIVRHGSSVDQRSVRPSAPRAPPSRA